MGLCQNKMNKTGVEDPTSVVHKEPHPKDALPIPAPIDESHVIQAKSNVTNPALIDNSPFRLENINESSLGKSSLRNPLGKEKRESITGANKKVIFNGVPSPVEGPLNPQVESENQQLAPLECQKEDPEKLDPLSEVKKDNEQMIEGYPVVKIQTPKEPANDETPSPSKVRPKKLAPMAGEEEALRILAMSRNERRKSELGIQAFDEVRNEAIHTEEMENKLGTATDKPVAKNEPTPEIQNENVLDFDSPDQFFGLPSQGGSQKDAQPQNQLLGVDAPVTPPEPSTICIDTAEKINPAPCPGSPPGNEIKVVDQETLRQSKDITLVQEGLRQSKEVIQVKLNADLDMTTEDIPKPSQEEKQLAMGVIEENLRISKDARETLVVDYMNDAFEVANKSVIGLEAPKVKTKESETQPIDKIPFEGDISEADFSEIQDEVPSPTQKPKNGIAPKENTPEAHFSEIQDDAPIQTQKPEPTPEQTPAINNESQTMSMSMGKVNAYMEEIYGQAIEKEQPEQSSPILDAVAQNQSMPNNSGNDFHSSMKTNDELGSKKPAPVGGWGGPENFIDIPDESCQSLQNVSQDVQLESGEKYRDLESLKNSKAAENKETGSGDKNAKSSKDKGDFSELDGKAKSVKEIDMADKDDDNLNILETFN